MGVFGDHSAPLEVAEGSNAGVLQGLQWMLHRELEALPSAGPERGVAGTQQ